MKKNDDEDIVEEVGAQGSATPTDDDIIVEEDADTVAPQAVIKKLHERLLLCKKERQEYLDGWQRAKADFINARKDDERERSLLRKHAKVDIIAELLPIADNFERAMANKELWEKVDKNWRVGVEYIYTQIQSLLRNQGVSEMGQIGERFDAVRHHSMEALPTARLDEDDTVVAVIEKGYMLHGKVIRPARVKIAHYTTELPGEETEQQTA